MEVEVALPFLKNQKTRKLDRKKQKVQLLALKSKILSRVPGGFKRKSPEMLQILPPNFFNNNFILTGHSTCVNNFFKKQNAAVRCSVVSFGVRKTTFVRALNACRVAASEWIGMWRD